MRYVACVIIGAALAGAAGADPCLEEVRAAYDAGANAETIAPFRQDFTQTNPDGAVIYTSSTIWESPVDSLTISAGQPFFVQRGRTMYTASDLAGPWSASDLGIEDPLGRYRLQHAQRLENLRDVTCHGIVERAGQSYRAYTWTTQTSPDAEGSYFGSTQTGFFDPGTGRLMLIEDTRAFGHWAPEPSPNSALIVYSYAPDIAVPDPN